MPTSASAPSRKKPSPRLLRITAAETVTFAWPTDLRIAELQVRREATADIGRVRCRLQPCSTAVLQAWRGPLGVCWDPTAAMLQAPAEDHSRHCQGVAERSGRARLRV